MASRNYKSWDSTSYIGYVPSYSYRRAPAEERELTYYNPYQSYKSYYRSYRSVP